MDTGKTLMLRHKQYSGWTQVKPWCCQTHPSMCFCKANNKFIIIIIIIIIVICNVSHQFQVSKFHFTTHTVGSFTVPFNVARKFTQLQAGRTRFGNWSPARNIIFARDPKLPTLNHTSLWSVCYLALCSLG